MATYATPAIPAGTFTVDPIHSSFGFAVRHMGVSTYRGTFDDVTARLESDGTAVRLEGQAKVESISIRTPDMFRAHVLGDDFLAAERHPEIAFRSTRVELRDGGEATVEGELEIKGISRPVTAHGEIQGPVTNPYGKTLVAVELSTVVDRRDYDMRWEATLPGSDKLALDYDVTITAHLEFVLDGE
jgi:polyisoprenoid-binding protein YceI